MDDDEQVRRCTWCGETYRLGAVGRRAVYCGRSCRQRAYEARREAERTADAVAAAVDSTRDEKARRRPRPAAAAGPVPLPLWPDADET